MRPPDLLRIAKQLVRSGGIVLDMLLQPIVGRGERAVLRPDLWLPRHHDRRVLEVVAGPHAYLGPGPWRLRIAVFDVLHRRATLEIELAREGRGLAVVDPGTG